METWQARRVRDKGRILAYLNTDRLYAAYAIGDLEPALYAQTTWAVAERGGVWRALAMHYRGLKVPALFIMGEPDGVRAILRTALCPPRAYVTCRPEHLPALQEFYAWDEPVLMWRMALNPGRFQPVDGSCLRLAPEHGGLLAELYAHGGGLAFTAMQLEQGVFYGIPAQGGSPDEGRIVAVAGTHLVSEAYGVAAIGNVFTHPDYREQGYAMRTTSAVVAELLRRDIRSILLNVAESNTAAIGVYERLGFHKHAQEAWFEATAVGKSAPGPRRSGDALF